jgi:hypothetical protein
MTIEKAYRAISTGGVKDATADQQTQLSDDRRQW